VTIEPGPSAARRAVTAVVFAVVLFAAVVIQLTGLNRLPLPGSAAPDLVLLLVTAIAVVTGPAAGAVAGFAGGLALDVAPPAAHYAGEYALVFCLAGYAAARVVRAIWDLTGERDPVATFTVMVAATVAGEAGKAALGLLLSDPHVTTAAAGRVLPAAILYDLVLSPFVFWLVCWATRAIRTWGTAPAEAPVPEFSRAQRLTLVFRQASAGAAPDLRLAGTGANYHHRSQARPLPRLRLAGTGANQHRRPQARPLPRLRLADTRSPAAARTRAAGTGGASFPVAGRRAAKLSFAGDLAPGTAGGGLGRRARTPGKNWLRGAGTSPALGGHNRPAAPRSPGRGWLGSGGRATRRSRSGTGLAGPPGSAAAALAARSAPSGVSALSGSATPLARHSPQAGWLRGSRSAVPSAASRRLTPRRGWLGGRRRRRVLGSGVSGRAAFRRDSITHHNWYTASPSGAWLRRSRHPWRTRRQRLLRKVGVGR
jgi:rod shape-determining protein MreD